MPCAAAVAAAASHHPITTTAASAIPSIGAAVSSAAGPASAGPRSGHSAAATAAAAARCGSGSTASRARPPVLWMRYSYDAQRSQRCSRHCSCSRRSACCSAVYSAASAVKHLSWCQNIQGISRAALKPSSINADFDVPLSLATTKPIADNTAAPSCYSCTDCWQLSNVHTANCLDSSTSSSW